MVRLESGGTQVALAPIPEALRRFQKLRPQVYFKHFPRAFGRE